MKKSSKNFFVFVLLFSSFNGLSDVESESPYSKLNKKGEEDDKMEEIQINLICDSDIIYIKSEGSFYFLTDFNDKEGNIFNISNILENTSFNTSIIDSDNKSFNITCRFWKPINNNLVAFCNIGLSDLNAGLYYINKTSFIYNSHLINIIPPPSEFILYPEEIPVLYSDEQVIEIQEWKNKYEIQFNIVQYNNDNIIMSFYFCFPKRIIMKLIHVYLIV